jgi:hypothetical protein
LWWRYINITITILDIIQHVLKLDILGAVFCLCLQVKPTQMSPIERASLCLFVGSETETIFFYWAHLSRVYEHIIYMIYICNPQSQLFLFRLLPHYMFWPLRAIFRWNKCININSVFVKTITLYLIHPLLHVLLSILYYLSINSYIIFFKIA